MSDRIAARIVLRLINEGSLNSLNLVASDPACYSRLQAVSEDRPIYPDMPQDKEVLVHHVLDLFRGQGRHGQTRVRSPKNLKPCERCSAKKVKCERDEGADNCDPCKECRKKGHHCMPRSKPSSPRDDAMISNLHVDPAVPIVNYYNPQASPLNANLSVHQGMYAVSTSVLRNVGHDPSKMPLSQCGERGDDAMSSNFHVDPAVPIANHYNPRAFSSSEKISLCQGTNAIPPSTGENVGHYPSNVFPVRTNYEYQQYIQGALPSLNPTTSEKSRSSRPTHETLAALSHAFMPGSGSGFTGIQASGSFGFSNPASSSFGFPSYQQ